MSLALAITLIALPAFGFALLPLWRRSLTPGPEAASRETAEELLETKRGLYRAIKEIEFDHQAGHFSDADHERLRASYEARAGRVLKALDEMGVIGSGETPRPGRVTASPQQIPSPRWNRRPAVLVLGAALLVGFGLVLGMLVVRFSAPEPSGSAGVMGTPAISVPQVAPGGSGQEGAARPIAPEMVRGMLDAAHKSLDAGQFQEAITAYKAILARYPQNVEAITHLGIILGIAGHTDGALEALDKALTIDPNYPHALWDKARFLNEAKQDYAGAIQVWERFVAVTPPGPDREQAQRFIQDARGKLGGKK